MLRQAIKNTSLLPVEWESSPPLFYETWADRCRYTLLLTAVAAAAVGLRPSNSPSQSVVLHNIKKSRL